MTAKQLQDIIQVSLKKKEADLVIKNCRIVNVYSHEIIEGDIAVCQDIIAGIGNYSCNNQIDAKGAYAIPGLIESHIHIESSFTTPEEFSRLFVPYGTTTVIADPHEITNVCGIEGFNYMLEAARNALIDIKFMVPSCVPATGFENSGAIISAAEISQMLNHKNVLGLGELMNFPGVINCDSEVLNKVCVTQDADKIIDGHAPGVVGENRQAYICARVKTDHECSTIQEMQESVQNGMYVQLRNGSACKDLQNLVKGITPEISRRCIFCSDDKQPVTIFNQGDLDNHLRICVKNGIDPITAVQMGSLNAAECYHLDDRGAIAAGKRADIILMEDLKDFNPIKVFVKGQLVAENKKCLKEIQRCPITKVTDTMNVAPFNASDLKLKLTSDNVHVIEITPGSIVTKNTIVNVQKSADGDFIFNSKNDIAKIAVVERHHKKGTIGVGLIKNYGIKKGAVAITIAHDSHNIICVGTSNEEMKFAIDQLIKLKGGIVIVKENQLIESMPLPVAGLMSDQNAEWVCEKLEKVNKAAINQLGVNSDIEPVSTLCFMSLPVIPELKITDKGLFDVTKFDFIDINA